jgi:hypothetical protein
VRVTAVLRVTQSNGNSGSADVGGSTVTTGGSIASYTVSWGDGSSAQTSSSSATMQHSYQHSGTFTVTLTVTANTGATASTSAPLALTVRPPTVILSISPTPSVSLSATVNVGGSVVEGWPLGTVTIAWGDGQTTQFAFRPNPGSDAVPHVYSTCPSGGRFYQISVTIADIYGNVGPPAVGQPTLACPL